MLLFYLIIFILGLCFGSFLNVVICRLENGEPILLSRSHCPKCGAVLEWYDLIPLLSFLIQKRRCRYCGKKISWQYPIVEIATGLLFLLIFSFNFSFFNLIYYFLIVSFLIIIFVYDLKYYIIPDKVVYPAIIAAFIVALIRIIYSGSRLTNILWLTAALLAGAGFFFLIVLISKGKWMGLGDVKLAVFMGLLLGWPNILIALFFSFILGALIGLVLILLKKKSLKSQIPFGPFLCLATLIALFYGSQIIIWYLSFWG